MPDVLERPALVAIGEIGGGRLVEQRDVHARAPCARRRPAVRLVERQRLQQHAIDDAEDRGVGADADAQRQHRDRRERWRPKKTPKHSMKPAESHRVLDGPAKLRFTC